MLTPRGAASDNQEAGDTEDETQKQRKEALASLLTDKRIDTKLRTQLAEFVEDASALEEKAREATRVVEQSKAETASILDAFIRANTEAAPETSLQLSTELARMLQNTNNGHLLVNASRRVINGHGQNDTKLQELAERLIQRRSVNDRVAQGSGRAQSSLFSKPMHNADARNTASAATVPAGPPVGVNTQSGVVNASGASSAPLDAVSITHSVIQKLGGDDGYFTTMDLN